MIKERAIADRELSKRSKECLNSYRGKAVGRTEPGLVRGEPLWLTFKRPSPVLLGFYCGTLGGLRVVQVKNSIGVYEKYYPGIAMTTDEVARGLTALPLL